MESQSRIGRRLLNRRFLCIVSLAACVLALYRFSGVAGADQGKGGPDLCGQTSRAMLKSCKYEALSDYWLAISRCDNLGTAAERTACRKEAGIDYKSALEDCKDQFSERQDVCGDLGRGPYNPTINPKNFTTKIDNPFLPLEPGTTFIYEGDLEDGHEHEELAVTHITKKILGVTCVEVRDISTVDGELVEDTLDWFAQDKDGNVWYFGESSKQFENGDVIGVEGSWQGGVDGAKPGIVMEAHPQKEDLYRQEFSLGNAEDMAEVVSLDESVKVPFGSFEHCLQTEEFSPIEPDVREQKFYAPGVGQVLTLEGGGRLELVEIQKE